MNLIFDIGANRGLFTDKCISKYTDVKVIAIEPNPVLFNFLWEKYKNNHNVIVLNNIVAKNSDEYIDFYISNADTISTASKDWITSSRFTNNYNWGQPIKVISVNLDKLINDFGNPKLIKIDVEGYEYEVISGLTKKTNEICFEWAEEQYEKINKTCDYLMSLGYNEFGYIEGDEHLLNPNVYTIWGKCEIHKNINPNRKEKWGMIWVK